MEEKILIDRETLKAIVVDTRMNILKLLSSKKYTLSDLAEQLELGNSTVKEHLDILVGSNLIHKEDTNRKWKYYSLSFKGKKLIQPREVKVLFAFAFSLIATVGFAVTFLRQQLFGSLVSKQEVLSKAMPVMEMAVEEASIATQKVAVDTIAAAPLALTSDFPIYLFFILLFLVGLTTLLLGIYLNKPQVIIIKKEK
jgi:predicted ArsR family transcriptional regulator